MFDATTAADGPVFDGESYTQVGATLLRAATERPQLGLKLGAQPGGADVGAHWFVGTILARDPDALDGDVRFTSGSPYLQDLARRMADGEFDLWVIDIAAALEAGVLHRVTRAHKTGVARAPLRVAASRPVEGPVEDSGERELAETADVGAVRFADVGAGASVVRRRQRR